MPEQQRRVIAWVTISMDGYTSGPGGPADDIWLYEHVQRASAAAYFEGIWRGASTVVVGRTNYEGFYSVWPGITADPGTDPRTRDLGVFLNTVEKVVVSRTLQEAGWENSRIARDLESEVKALRDAPGRDILVINSASIIQALLRAGLIDDLRFAVVPDATTEALELRKGTGDIASNSLTPDTVLTLQRDPFLAVEHAPGTEVQYLGFNLRDPILKNVRVRQAIAYALDRRPMIEYLWRGQARPARSVLPPQSWAYDGNVPAYDHDPEKARALLDAAGYPAVNGVRFHLTMKTSTTESTRLIVAVMQQQLREVGIALDIRSFEAATFFADVTHGAFQLYSLRWVGGNQDPDIFYVFHSSRFPPNGANRGFYSNPKVDALIDQARREVDPAVRKPLYAELQRILAEELPYVDLWYLDNVLVHNKRVVNLKLNPAGNYDFLRIAELAK